MNIGVVIVWLTLGLCHAAFAAEIVVKLPDAALTDAIQSACTYFHCEKDGQWKTSDGKALWVMEHLIRNAADMALRYTPGTHPKSLDELGATLTIRYDVYPADWQRSN